MKVHLMFKDHDFEVRGTSPAGSDDLRQDLELTTILETMARGDPALYGVAEQALFSGTPDPETILYRQGVLRDCIAHRALAETLYGIAVTALQETRRIWRGSSPSSRLHGSISALEVYVVHLQHLRALAEEHRNSVRSEGMTALLDTLERELDDAYFAEITDHLTKLRFKHGVLVSAHLTTGNRGGGYVLREATIPKESWFRRTLARRRDIYGFQVHERDEAGARALRRLEARGIGIVAEAVTISTEHVADFLRALSTELAFFIACVNLYERIGEIGAPVSFPSPVHESEPSFTTSGLYDVALCLLRGVPIVGNDVEGDGTWLTIVTGTNQGGKSTFLRSVGLAQLMMQAGMFVGAHAYRASTNPRVFTHFKRAEDPTMTSGKLDEELVRMDRIADELCPESMVLFNESFASTNEREGSEIARQVVRALVEARVRVVFVTHLYDFAHSVRVHRTPAVGFLRADRDRTFKLVEGPPRSTSHGADLYEQVFGTDGRLLEKTGGAGPRGGGSGGT